MYARAMLTDVDVHLGSYLKFYRVVILSCSLLSSPLSILSDAGCFQMLFTILPSYTHYADAFTDPGRFFFPSPALKISQLTNLAPFSGLFPGIPYLHYRNPSLSVGRQEQKNLIAIRIIPSSLQGPWFE